MSKTSVHAAKMLESLQRAVAQSLEKKRALGQYAVIWSDNRPAFIGNDSHSPSSKLSLKEDPSDDTSRKTED